MFQPLITFSLTVTSLLAAWLVVLRCFWRQRSSLRSILVNVSLALFTVAYLFIFLEIAFANLMVASDGFGFTLLSKRWYEKYWGPTNAQGFRDRDHVWKDKVLFVVGDSFVAGHGIDDISDRFAGVLAERLSENWSVAVIAQNGWDSAAALEALREHPQKPSRIIVSHFVNDIEGAARENGITRAKPVGPPHPLIRPIVDRSFVFNWLYWRLYRGDVGGSYLKYLHAVHANPEVLRAHEQELAGFLEYADTVGAEIAFIVWPLLFAVSQSGPFTSPVVAYLEAQGIVVLDLQPLLADRRPADLVVNSADAHPNVQVNAEVAELIYERLAPWD